MESIINQIRIFLQNAEEAKKKGNFTEASELYMLAGRCAASISMNNPEGSPLREAFAGKAKSYYEVATQCKERTLQKKAKPVEVGSETEHIKKDIKPIIEAGEDAITFADVAGLEEVKNVIMRKVLLPLKNPEKARKYNVKPGAMVLMYGLPGTGKTMIARAIAGEVGAPFYQINCQDLISKYIGESSHLLQAKFDEALENDKAIMFFDEFDAIAAKRSSATDGADQEMNRFMGTFLTNIGNSKNLPKDKMLLVIAATNRPEAIDKAMLRGQRIDVQLYIDLPDKKSRAFLIKKEFKGIKRDNDFNLKEMVDIMEGYGCADIVTVCENIRSQLFYRDLDTGVEQLLSRRDYMNALYNADGQWIHPTSYEDSQREAMERQAKTTHHDGIFEASDDFND